jgi:hypothetical protein
MITNTDRQGRVMDGKWYIRVGKRNRTFGEKDWLTEGLAWLNGQMSG